jgi:hypothetical protein
MLVGPNACQNCNQYTEGDTELYNDRAYVTYKCECGEVWIIVFTPSERTRLIRGGSNAKI